MKYVFGIPLLLVGIATAATLYHGGNPPGESAKGFTIFRYTDGPDVWPNPGGSDWPPDWYDDCSECHTLPGHGGITENGVTYWPTDALITSEGATLPGECEIKEVSPPEGSGGDGGAGNMVSGRQGYPKVSEDGCCYAIFRFKFNNIVADDFVFELTVWDSQGNATTRSESAEVPAGHEIGIGIAPECNEKIRLRILLNGAVQSDVFVSCKTSVCSW